MNFLISPIFPVKERTSEERFQVRRPIDSRINGFVLEKIGQAKSALLPSVISPEIISFFSTGLEVGKMGYFHQKKRHKQSKSLSPRKKPIGLTPPEPEGWVCAIMQFILHVPKFADLFSLAPRSFFPIQEFIDQYRQDLEEGKSFSVANGQALFRLFHFRFPDFSPVQIVGALMTLINPKWKIYPTIQEALLFAKTPDLFLYTGALRKQLYAAPGPYYDLDAFIEKRPDGIRSNYICHVKVEGCWYQCDETRVTQLRSDLLALPLQRAILSHYAQVRF